LLSVSASLSKPRSRLLFTDYWVKDQFPFDLLPAVKELGIGGLGMKGYGCCRRKPRSVGLCPNGDRTHSTRRSRRLSALHNGLAMGSIYIDGSEEQKQKWLPPMARFD